MHGLNPFSMAVWGEIAKNNDRYGITDIQLHLDSLAEEYECELMEKHYNEQRNEQSQTKSSIIDVSNIN